MRRESDTGKSNSLLLNVVTFFLAAIGFIVFLCFSYFSDVNVRIDSLSHL